MKKLILFSFLLIGTCGAMAQKTGKTPPANKEIKPGQTGLNKDRRPAVPLGENPFNAPAYEIKPLPKLEPKTLENTEIYVIKDDAGFPIFFEGKTVASIALTESSNVQEQALLYVESLKMPSISNALAEFSAVAVHTDEQGNTHVRFNQTYNGIPVYGAEMVAHTQAGKFQMANGRYFPTPSLNNTTPALYETAAIQTVKNLIGADNIKTEWSPMDLKIIGKTAPFTANLVIYHVEDKRDAERLVWVVEAHPNLMRRDIYFVDAMTGASLNYINHTCNLTGTHFHGDCLQHGTSEPEPTLELPTLGAGPVVASGLDLLNVSRTFGAWDAGSNQIVLEDASKPMYNAGASTMPNDPVGVVVTLDALNTSPEVQNTFDYQLIISNSVIFNYKTAVSGHWNSIKSYDYFKNTFNRNSIDGTGGNIIAFINVAEGDGSSMENAFWNGAAMWYGNGGSTFKQLARGLDVGGHEMTHGVVEKTANLVYQNESGALNESFADIFGAMIDRDDWKIGEDVVQSGVSPNGCLRDMQNPNNNAAQNSQWWQPKHTNQQYTGTQDNGGVHINSGIPNHAFYLFATNANVGKEKAEQVFYKALRDYLVKSSKFIDCRIAVVQAATDLYGATVANAAAEAFTAVGIGSGSTGGGGQQGGNYLGQLTTNPGEDYILCVSNNGLNLDLADGNGVVFGTLYNQGIKSRPSVTDNGTQIVFVNDAGHIITIDLQYVGSEIFPTVNPPLSDEPIWRNAAISKDGRFLAAITDVQEPRIYIFDLADPFFESELFFLENPTYSQEPTSTGEVRYADVMEFDYSGRYLMYDAYNDLSNGTNDLSYWDISFVEFWKNNAFVDGGNAFYSKLFNGIPENTSIGNPTFAKNSPYIIGFDYIDDLLQKYDIYGANVETGDYNVIVSNNGDLGWPNYNRLDNAIIFHRKPLSSYNIVRQGIKANKIEPQGSAVTITPNHFWGVWYADGNRSLMVDANEADAPTVQMTLSPNPANDLTRMQIDIPHTTTGRIELRDLRGSLIESRTYDLNAGVNTLDIPLANYASGTYFISLITPETRVVARLVKQ